MSKLIGIDIRSKCVRMAALSTRYRRVSLEALVEVNLAEHASTADAIRHACQGLALQGDPVACGFAGDACFVHRLELPPAAAKRLAEIVPFELEAQVPVDVDELVYDYTQLSLSKEGLVVLAAAARSNEVQQRIALLRDAIDREPERISVAGFPLANLVPLSPALAAPGPVALLDMGDEKSEFIILKAGRPVLNRTLSAGVAGLPTSASVLAAALRQSFAAWSVAGGAPVQALYLVGSGSGAPGAEEYLSQELGITVSPLPELAFHQTAEGTAAQISRFASAIGIALGLRAGARDLDLRRGALSYQRGFGFLKEKVPVLAGLSAAVLVSFLFYAWAQNRTLGKEYEALTADLAKATKDALGEETTDPERVDQLLGELLAAKEKDPQPSMDAFDVLVKFSEVVPQDITHDIEEFDVQRSHVKVYGVVDATEQAEQVSSGLQSQECFEGVKVSKIAQKVNSDRQKYTLEFDIKCPEDKAKAKGGSGAGGAAAEGEQSDSPGSEQKQEEPQ
jgi:general secretion pathway protein L